MMKSGLVMPSAAEHGPLTRAAQRGALDLYVRSFFQVALTENELDTLNTLVGLTTGSEADTIISAFLETL